MAEDYYNHTQEVKLQGDCCQGCAGSCLLREQEHTHTLPLILGIIFLVNVPRRRYLDFSNSTTEKIETAHGFQGVYSAYIFAAEAQRLIVRHKELYSAQPFFLYL